MTDSAEVYADSLGWPEYIPVVTDPLMCIAAPSDAELIRFGI